MQFPTAHDSPIYQPIRIIDRSPIRTDLRSPYPGDGFRFVDDAARHWSTGPGRLAIRVASLVAVLALALTAGALVAGPAIEAMAFRVAPSPELPVMLKTE